MSDEKMLERIVLDPTVMTGKPVIKGTRLTVDFILSLLAHGATLDEVVMEYKRAHDRRHSGMSGLCREVSSRHGVFPSDKRACVMRFLVDECTGPAVAKWLKMVEGAGTRHFLGL